MDSCNFRPAELGIDVNESSLESIMRLRPYLAFGVAGFALAPDNRQRRAVIPGCGFTFAQRRTRELDFEEVLYVSA